MVVVVLMGGRLVGMHEAGLLLPRRYAHACARTRAHTLGMQAVIDCSNPIPPGVTALEYGHKRWRSKRSRATASSCKPRWHYIY